MNDDDRLKLAKNVLDHHFGINEYDGTGKRISDKVICATCDAPTPWPCSASLLAEAVQEEVLAR